MPRTFTTIATGIASQIPVPGAEAFGAEVGGIMDSAAPAAWRALTEDLGGCNTTAAAVAPDGREWWLMPDGRGGSVWARAFTGEDKRAYHPERLPELADGWPVGTRFYSPEATCGDPSTRTLVIELRSIVHSPASLPASSPRARARGAAPLVLGALLLRFLL